MKSHYFLLRLINLLITNQFNDKKFFIPNSQRLFDLDYHFLCSSFVSSITLENVKCNICTLSVKVPIDDSTDFTIKLKTYNRGWKLIANNIDTDTKIKIKKMSCDNGEVTVFILSELELKSGYEYKFLLEIGDSEDKHESNSFVLKGKIY